MVPDPVQSKFARFVTATTQCDECSSTASVENLDTSYGLELYEDKRHVARQLLDDLEEDISQVAHKVLQSLGAADASFGISVMDPRCPASMNPAEYSHCFAAVSDNFLAMTGYNSAEALGRSYRFLSDGCRNAQEDMTALRQAGLTGDRAVTVLENMRKDGSKFLNVLDVQGLEVAEHAKSGEKLWVLIGLHGFAKEDCRDLQPFQRLQDFATVTSHARAVFVSEFAHLALSALDGLDAGWRPLAEPAWRGESEVDVRLLEAAELRVSSLAAEAGLSRAAQELGPSAGPRSYRASAVAVCAGASIAAAAVYAGIVRQGH